MTALSENENERLIVFSDAVIAITITLLVLDIRLPAMEEPITNAALWSALVSLQPNFVAYALSFMVIGVFWLGHRAKFEFIIRHSPTLIWLNLIFLLEIGMMPFVTSIISESDNAVATILYAATVAVISFTSGAMTYYALRAGLTDLPRSRAWRVTWPLLIPGLIFALSIPIALYSSSLAQWSWLLLIPASTFTGRHQPEGI